VVGEDFALTLFTYRHIQQRQRRQAHAERGARIDAAQLGMFAFHTPRELTLEAQRHEAASRDLVAPRRAPTDLIALGRAFAEGVESGRVLEN
jgi:hypothetical protein